jgi:hypothetical protein
MLKYFWILFFFVVSVWSGILIYPIVKDKLQKNHPIKIGICCQEPPYEYLEKNGEIQGYLKDLIQQVKKTSKKNLKLEIIPFSFGFFSLKKCKIDILCTNLTINQERSNLYDFAFIFKNQIVFVFRTHTEENKVIYGLSGNSEFQKVAEEKKVNYKSYKDFPSIFLNFELGKIDGIVSDLKTIKQLVEKNFQNITTLKPIEIQWTDNILILKNNHTFNKNYGILSKENIKYCSSNGSIRQYHNLKDLLLAFRCGEIHSVILKKNELQQDFNKFSGLQIKYNSNNLQLKNSLKIKYKNNYWIIEKDNNKKNIIIGVINHDFINGYENKFYENLDILFNDLIED